MQFNNFPPIAPAAAHFQPAVNAAPIPPAIPKKGNLGRRVVNLNAATPIQTVAIMVKNTLANTNG